ncbi:restriction endonuclease subunit S [Enterococcus hirae]|uniref:restriction endonuclease subunit S n=1 Tax=Enterococcus hirae TaxID=1354 RepID=UPI00296B38F0|nr:restriction endonuclease subunit S [Enterococcus hirae]MDW3666427.1 restriction endonuclease subunit S [Enterococcus hirae]
MEWIGEIPESWEVIKLKYLGDYINGYAFKPSDWSNSGLPIIRIQNLTKETAEINYFNGKIDPKYYVYEGDILISWSATIDIFVWLRGKAVLNQHIFKVNVNEKKVKKDYFFYALKIALYEMSNDKHGSAMQHVTKNIFDNYKIPFPSIEIQEAIAKRLDEELYVINSIISETQQSIDELKKYKQALITETVTKGLDKNVEMKDSGIEWIKKVPKSWEIKKTRFFLKEVSEKNYPNEEILSLYRDYGVIPKNSRDDNHNVTSLDTSGYKLVNHNQLVINKMKAWQGSMAISEIRGIISPAYYVYEVLDKQIYTKFLHYALRNNAYLDEYRRISAGLRIGQWDLNKDLFKNVKIAFPSTMDEQRQIVDFLEEKIKWIDNIVIEKEQLLIQFEQLKQSLIYEYVTGKKEA